MTFADLDVDELTYRGAERIRDHLEAIASEVTPGREHWSTCLRLFCRVVDHHNEAPELAAVLHPGDLEALAKVQPELDGLLSRVWHHGQWKLGELAAWQRVWLHLRQMHETMTREVSDGT